jgi:SAM-dependent methyltransferase
MQNKIEILDPDLIERYPERLREIDRWRAALRLSLGWHYCLDLIWIMESLKQAGLPRGAWILDAGAGQGLLQFLLASGGFNVLSLDFTERVLPKRAQRFFAFERQTHALAGRDHPYREFLHGRGRAMPAAGLRALRFAARHPLRAFELAAAYAHASAFEVRQLARRSGAYGKIVYALGDFRRLEGIRDASIDGIVSLSALEHGSRGEIAQALQEFKRVLKPAGGMFLTVSAAKDRDWFFEPCRGWCFCEDTLKALFDLKQAKSNFDCYEAYFEKLKRSSALQRRIAPAYYLSGENGLPWGRWQPLYQPVGIVRGKG